MMAKQVTNSNQLSRLVLKGYKSIAECDLPLGSINVLIAELYFGNNGYRFQLKPTQDNRMMFAHEALWWNMRGEWQPASGHFETRFKDGKGKGYIWDYTVPAMRSWRVYHFHDTSTSALGKQVHGVGDYQYLREDARNLAAFLQHLKDQHHSHY